MPTIRVINLRAAGHTLPGLPNTPYESNRVLLPGGNNLDSEYLECLKGHMGPQGYERFLKSVDGYLTIMSPEESAPEIKKPEGPPPPANLLDRIPELAIAFVEVESDPKVLERWLKAEKQGAERTDVQAAMKARLIELKGAKK